MTAEEQNVISITLPSEFVRQIWVFVPAMLCFRIFLISRRNMTNACPNWMMCCLRSRL